MNSIARATSVALFVTVLGLAASAARAPEAPVFAISHEGSSIKFNVKGFGTHRRYLRQVGIRA